jgi:hypothetical protein
LEAFRIGRTLPLRQVTARGGTLVRGILALGPIKINDRPGLLLPSRRSGRIDIHEVNCCLAL